MSDCTALFDSIHDVMAAEKALKRAGVRHDLVPVPRHLGSDCGMAIDFSREDLPRFEAALAQAGIRARSIHRSKP
jgi:hypothetical protein